MGDHAVARAAALARVEVISAYPITPQTLIVEELSELCARGECDAKFIKVESEHSALACCIGASVTGARAFTATSSQGLLYMHEMIHWAAGSRLPIVMVNVNRAVGPPWNLWCDQSDSLCQRDTGWIQLYCESSQEVLDTIFQAYKIAEQVSIPTMVCLDAFFLSHTSEVVDIPEIEMVDSFLPPYQPEIKIDPDAPLAFGGIVNGEHYQKLRQAMNEDILKAKSIVAETDEAFEKIFGRGYGLLETYQTDDAELILVTSGTVAGTARLAIDALRKAGMAVGLLKVRLFRPFPGREIASAIGSTPKIAVLDRNLSVGTGGFFAQELKAAMYHMDKRPTIMGIISGLGGGDFTPKSIETIISKALKRQPSDDAVVWEEL